MPTPPTATVLLNRLLVRGKFRHLQVLLKLAELGSLQRTAAAIGMTQSAVTQTLAYLERLLEMPLFERHARGVRPTQACRNLLPVARQLMQGVAEGAELLAAQHQQAQQAVRLMASAAATSGLLLPALPAFHAAHPDIGILLREAEGADQLLAIARGEADLVACRQPPVVPDGWTFQPLCEDRYVVVCAPGHRLARARALDWPDVAGERWLQIPAGSAARERFDALVADWPQPPALYPLVTRMVSPLTALLRAAPLLVLLPLSVVRQQVDARELAVLPMPDAGPLLPLGLLQPAQAMGRAAQLLVDWLATPQAPAPPQSARRAMKSSTSRLKSSGRSK